MSYCSISPRSRILGFFAPDIVVSDFCTFLQS